MRYCQKLWIRLVAMPVASCFFLVTAGGCRPDLIVSSYSGEIEEADPSSRKYRVTFKIKNVGTAPSGKTSVHINAIDSDPPGGANPIRIQKSTDVTALQPGEESVTFQVTFGLAKIKAKDVDTMRISVDPEQVVNESRETNNIASWTWP